MFTNISETCYCDEGDAIAHYTIPLRGHTISLCFSVLRCQIPLTSHVYVRLDHPINQCYPVCSIFNSNMTVMVVYSQISHQSMVAFVTAVLAIAARRFLFPISPGVLWERGVGVARSHRSKQKMRYVNTDIIGGEQVVHSRTYRPPAPSVTSIAYSPYSRGVLIPRGYSLYVAIVTPRPFDACGVYLCFG